MRMGAQVQASAIRTRAIYQLAVISAAIAAKLSCKLDFKPSTSITCVLISSIQVTVDTYGHLIPGANLCFVGRLDEVPAKPAEKTPQQSAAPAQQGDMEVPTDLMQVVGGGGWTRTNDLRIMRPSL
jgi:hypothetical protein